MENKDSHILDRENRARTLQKLGSILKIWQWNRPYEFDYCFQKMEKSIEKISDSYNRIRNFSLIEFDKVPEKDLKIIWYEFGKIKDQDNTSNFYGELVMTITKPLMFLWGQTPAFDSVVRAKMPLLNHQGFNNTRWEFSLWLRVMKELQNYLNDNAELTITFRKKSQEKYGTNRIVPFGQFLDLYYWTENRLDTGLKTEDDFGVEKKQKIGFEEEKRQEEYHNLVSLLNKLRSAGKISAVERRDYEKNWRNQPNNRDLLMKELERKLSN